MKVNAFLTAAMVAVAFSLENIAFTVAAVCMLSAGIAFFVMDRRVTELETVTRRNAQRLASLEQSRPDDD